MRKSQTKSKQRITDHGEVFTAEREVNAMLDLVKQETERIESRFLEPACGDALTLKQADDSPIIFAEWSALNGCMMKRRDFRLDQMLEGHQEQITLFMTGWEYDEEIQAFIPLPIREFPPIHYRKVQQYE